MNVVLFQPEIPPNTGSVARLCAATLTRLHLIEPLGFTIDDKHLKRAGLDYWEFVDLSVHKSWQEFLTSTAPQRLWFFSKRAELSYTRARYGTGDYLVFGPETRGLPARSPCRVGAAHSDDGLRRAQFEFVQCRLDRPV
jgi:tRNA (cytidine/uridine-2'-O-)-methyltransferase